MKNREYQQRGKIYKVEPNRKSGSEKHNNQSLKLMRGTQTAEVSRQKKGLQN